MRVFGTIFFGLIFLVVFCAFFLVHSVVGMPTDSTVIVGAMEDADFHGAMVQVVEEAVKEKAEEESLDPKFTRHVLGQVRPIVETVLPRDWFYETLTSAHQGLVGYIETGKDSTAIDLRSRKKDLVEKLFELGEEAVALCKEKGGGEACDDVERVTKAFEEYKGKILTAMDKIPDETNLTALVNKSGGGLEKLEESKEMKDIREGLVVMKTARLVGAGVLLFLLLLIALINMRSLPRVLVNVGLVLAIAGGFYLASVNTAGPALKTALAQEMAEDSTGGGDRMEKIGRETGSKVALAVIERGYKRSNTPVMILFAAAAFLFVAGIVLHSRRKKSLPVQVPQYPAYPQR